MNIRGYNLQKHDIFYIKWMDEKCLLGMPIIIHKVYYDRKWNKPYTWFQKCYQIEYIGDNKIERKFQEVFNTNNRIMR